MPSLTVVKLKPQRAPPPPIETETDVQEPSQEDLEALIATSPGAHAAQAAQAGADDSAEALESADPQAAAQAPVLTGADLAFDEAMADLKTGNISGAVLKLQTFAAENPRHAQSDNALYFSGVGLMSLDDYGGAASAFERVLSEYPAGDARLESMLKLAECRMRLNQKDDALALFARVIETYPGTDAA